MTKTVEYRIRPVSRFHLTRWEASSDVNGESSGCESIGEFDNEALARRMLEAAANHEKRPEGVEMILTADGLKWHEA